MSFRGIPNAENGINKHYGGYKSMEKITKKSFVEALTTNVSVLVGNVFKE